MVSTPTQALPARHRNTALVVVDIVVSVVLLFFGIVLSLTAITYANQFGTFTAGCATGSYPGLQCNGTALGIAVFGLITVAVLAALLAFGMIIVSLIRRRYTFWWPLGGILVTVAAFYLASWLAGATVPTS